MSGVNPKVPVFSIISFGLNNWVLGGYSPNYRQQGPDMAKQAINIEKGEEANIKFIPNEYIFDFNKIKESDIPIEKLPRNSILLIPGPLTKDSYAIPASLIFFDILPLPYPLNNYKKL